MSLARLCRLLAGSDGGGGGAGETGARLQAGAGGRGGTTGRTGPPRQRPVQNGGTIERSLTRTARETGRNCSRKTAGNFFGSSGTSHLEKKKTSAVCISNCQF